MFKVRGGGWVKGFLDNAKKIVMVRLDGLGSDGWIYGLGK